MKCVGEDVQIVGTRVTGLVHREHPVLPLDASVNRVRHGDALQVGDLRAGVASEALDEFPAVLRVEVGVQQEAQQSLDGLTIQLHVALAHQLQHLQGEKTTY